MRIVVQRTVGPHHRHQILQRSRVERRLVGINAGRELMQHSTHTIDNALERVELRWGQRHVARTVHRQRAHQIIQRLGDRHDRAPNRPSSKFRTASARAA